LTKILTANTFLSWRSKGEKLTPSSSILALLFWRKGWRSKDEKFHLAGVLSRAAVLEKTASKKRKAARVGGVCMASMRHMCDETY